MRRRHYLASTAALLAGPLAGCAHPNAVLEMSELSDAEIAERASRSVANFPPARHIVAEAVENGSTTVSGRSRPLETERPFVYEGRYYELSVTETGQRETTEFSIRIDYDTSGTPEGTAVDYDDLPAVDRDALDALLPPPAEDHDHEGFDLGVGAAYSEAEQAESVLVPVQEYDAVGYEGERYSIDVGDGRPVTVTDYRYEAAEIASTAEAFGASVREEYVFTLSGLSEAEREIVEEATDDGYYEDGADDAFESLARRFHEHEGVETDDGGGDWLARYEGTDYWAELRHPPGAIEGSTR